MSLGFRSPLILWSFCYKKCILHLNEHWNPEKLRKLIEQEFGLTTNGTNSNPDKDHPNMVKSYLRYKSCSRTVSNHWPDCTAP